MDVLRNQQSKPQHICKKLLKENSRFFCFVDFFKSGICQSFFQTHFLKICQQHLPGKQGDQKCLATFFVGDVCLTRSQSLQLFLFSCALFVVAFIELSLSLFVLFSLFENAYRCLLNIRSSMLLFFSSQCFYFWFCSHCVK